MVEVETGVAVKFAGVRSEDTALYAFILPPVSVQPVICVGSE